MNQTELAYVAGFVDGEGCIRIEHDHGHRYWLSLGVANGKREVLQWMRDSFDLGVVRVRKAKRKEHCDGVMWFCYSGQVAAVLQKILPYMRVKKRHAEIALEFQVTLGRQGIPVPPAVLEVRKKLRAEMYELNRRGPT